jgi:hypothetical protein
MTTLIRRFAFLDVLLAHAGRRRSVLSGLARQAAPEAWTCADLDERRGVAMRRLFPKLHDWRAGPGDRSAVLHAYMYLSEADSGEDLEQRIHHVAHRRHSRH